jgi:hypothetical protein
MEAAELLPTLASELHLTETDLLREGMAAVLQRQIRQLNADISEICGRYRVTGAEALQARYEDGSLPEADSWRDLQRLDHLEYKRDRLRQLLDQVQ